MSDYFLASEYPPDAIGGADFFTLAARRTLIDLDLDGTERRRPERVIVTSRDFDLDNPRILDGRVCVGEQTIRSMAGMLGLVDPNTVTRLEIDNHRLRARNDQLDAENAALKLALDASARVSAVYVAPDGRTFGTEQAAVDYARGEIIDRVSEVVGPLPEA